MGAPIFFLLQQFERALSSFAPRRVFALTFRIFPIGLNIVAHFPRLW